MNPMKEHMDIEVIEAGLRNKILKAITKTASITFGFKVSESQFWNFAKLLFAESFEDSEELINGLIFAARQDFRASEVLYDEKLYAPAVYHLQQSVEKLTKAFGLWNGFLSEKELKGKPKNYSTIEKIALRLGIFKKEETVDHISPKAFLIILKKRFVKEYFKFIEPNIKSKQFREKLENMDNDMASFERLISKGKTKAMASLKEAEIDSVLKIGYDYKTAFSNIDKHKLNSLVMGFKLGLKNRFEKFLPHEDYHEVYAKLETVDKRIETLLVGLNAFSLLYPLTVITYPHFTFTRYPTKEFKPTDYTEDLGIVKSLPKILVSLRDVLDGFEAIIK